MKDKDDIIQNIESEIEGLQKKNHVILDISSYPELTRLVNMAKLDFSKTYYVPDTIVELLNKDKYYFITRLFNKWTRRDIDLMLLKEVLTKKEDKPLNVKIITKEMVDLETYNFCYNTVVEKDLVLETSPEFNLLGDIIGKILGFAKKKSAPILMSNQRLARFIKKDIPIFYAANVFIDKKQEFFSKFIPLKKTRGVRWFIALTIGTFLSPVGFILAVIDP